MIRSTRISLSIAVAIGIVVVCGAMTPKSDPHQAAWMVHRNSDAHIEISHPADWEVIVAEERLTSRTAWSRLVLEKGELFKVTFRQRGEVPWPGQYEIRLLANPDNLGLEAFWSSFDLSDLWDGSAADSAVGGRPSKTWVRWMHDSLAREHLLIMHQGAVHIRYDEHNSNDPAFQDHQQIYVQMTSTFRVLPTQEAAGDSTAVRQK